jgi:2-dehydro-3-deoxyphosphogalactonate aldolase
MYQGPIAAAAAIQLGTCSPNFLIQEYNVNDLHSEIFMEPIRFEQGYIIPPRGPGLGVELNEAVVQRQLSR